MARKSIDSRMDRIYEALLPVGSMARREYELPDHLREVLSKHHARTAAIIDRAEKSEPGGAYAAMIDGALQLPDFPSVLRDAFDLSDSPIITVEHTAGEAAALWANFALGKKQ